MTGRRVIRIALFAVAAAMFGLMSIWSVQGAVADYWFQKETPEATRKALSLTPDQSEYQVRLALLIGEEEAAKALTALRRATAVNPSDGRAWVELGLRLEASGNLTEAEAALLRAAEEDKTYIPRWTLMNYYFRRDRRDRFWDWAKAAAPMLHQDPTSFFQLCSKVADDGALLDLLQIRNPHVQAAYLVYLRYHDRLTLTMPAIRHVLAGNRAVDVPLLLDTCDQLIESRMVGDALTIWAGLSRAHRLPFREDSRSILTNGDFAVPPSGRGFDWRIPRVDGVDVGRTESPSGLRFIFSGDEAERVELLHHFVPVEPKTAYALSYLSQTDIAPGSGLAWEVAGADITAADEISSDELKPRRLAFVTSPGCRMVRLSLVYGRRPGTRRIKGSLILRNVDVRR